MVVKLCEIFIPEPNRWIYSKADLSELTLHDAFIKYMSSQLAIHYNKNNSPESNLCFTNRRDLRPEYKTSFWNMDVVHCICALLSADNANQSHDIKLDSTLC